MADVGRELFLLWKVRILELKVLLLALFFVDRSMTLKKWLWQVLKMLEELQQKWCDMVPRL